MSTSIRHCFAVLVFAVLVFAGMLLPAAAHADDIMVGGQFRLGLAHVDTSADNNANDDDDTGFGLGGQLFAIYKFMEEIGVGLNFDFNVSFHEFGDNDNDVEASEVGFGVIVRSDLIEVLALVFWLNYTAGELEVDTGFFGNLEEEGDGVEVGLGAFYKIEVSSMPIFIEVGGVLTYGNYEPEDDDVFDDVHYINFMAAVQGNFQIGL